MEVLEQRLNDTNLALAAAESERDKLRKELDLANRNKQSLLTWKVAKTQLLAELEGLRNDFKWEEYFESTDDKQSMVSYWKKRFVDSNHSLQQTLEDNERLLEAIRAAGLEVPQEVQQSRTSTAQAGTLTPAP